MAVAGRFGGAAKGTAEGSTFGACARQRFGWARAYRHGSRVRASSSSSSSVSTTVTSVFSGTRPSAVAVIRHPSFSILSKRPPGRVISHSGDHVRCHRRCSGVRRRRRRPPGRTARGFPNGPRTRKGRIIYCWLSSSSPTGRHNYGPRALGGKRGRAPLVQ